MIRVLLVDDSPIALHVLKKLLLYAPDISVVGTASNGREALDLLVSLNPDVVSTDLHMPQMNGLELTRAIMSTHPLPILVVSVSVEPGSPNVFHLLEAGAVDVYPKPTPVREKDDQKFARELASKIRIVSGVHVFRSLQASNHSPALSATTETTFALKNTARLVVIGSSTGGPQALHTILSSLPPSFPLPIVCIQHIGTDFLPEMLHWLAEISQLPIQQAIHGDQLKGGNIYFAPGHSHLELNAIEHFQLTDGEPYDGHRPSITITMRSVARYFGAHTIGILLTGMGKDGAEGMAAISNAGGVTIAQDEASSVVYGMPQAAVALGAANYVLPLEQIAGTLVAMATGNRNTTISLHR